jgi:hypothetical protein
MLPVHRIEARPESPLERKLENQISAPKVIGWNDRDSCFGRTILEVVINSWPTLGLFLDNDIIICSEFVSFQMEARIVRVSECHGFREVRTYWKHLALRK